LFDPVDLEKALDAAVRQMKADRVPPNDVKAKAKILRAILNELAPEGDRTP